MRHTHAKEGVRSSAWINHDGTPTRLDNPDGLSDVHSPTARGPLRKCQRHLRYSAVNPITWASRATSNDATRVDLTSSTKKLAARSV